MQVLSGMPAVRFATLACHPVPATVQIVKLTFVKKTVSPPSGSPPAIPPATSLPAKSGASAHPPRRLLLAVPNVSVNPDQTFVNRDLGLDQPDSTPKILSATCRIPLSPAESTLFQEGVRRLKLSLLNLVGGSFSWRMFLGSSAAVFIGAATLACIGPSSKASTIPHLKTAKQPASSNLAPVEPKSSSDGQSKIELTVGTSEVTSGQEPAEFDDPFVPENRVQPKYLHALHLTTRDGPPESTTIRQVSRNRGSVAPANLVGTIETNDETAPL
ncbi:MAG: hypothetical protein JWM11_456, partial [Planctomycetaceae bacterium]|nr:hypothetical protein [Planctomycetaceae bacterium]